MFFFNLVKYEVAVSFQLQFPIRQAKKIEDMSHVTSVCSLSVRKRSNGFCLLLTIFSVLLCEDVSKSDFFIWSKMIKYSDLLVAYLFLLKNAFFSYIIRTSIA